jgi:hypothetical protein
MNYKVDQTHKVFAWRKKCFNLKKAKVFYSWKWLCVNALENMFLNNAWKFVNACFQIKENWKPCVEYNIKQLV